MLNKSGNRTTNFDHKINSQRRQPSTQKFQLLERKSLCCKHIACKRLGGRNLNMTWRELRWGGGARTGAGVVMLGTLSSLTAAGGMTAFLGRVWLLLVECSEKVASPCSVHSDSSRESSLSLASSSSSVSNWEPRSSVSLVISLSIGLLFCSLLQEKKTNTRQNLPSRRQENAKEKAARRGRREAWYETSSDIYPLYIADVKCPLVVRRSTRTTRANPPARLIEGEEKKTSKRVPFDTLLSQRVVLFWFSFLPRT